MPTDGICKCHSRNAKCPFRNAKCPFHSRFLFSSSPKDGDIMGLNEIPEELWHKVGFMQCIGFCN